MAVEPVVLARLSSVGWRGEGIQLHLLNLSLTMSKVSFDDLPLQRPGPPLNAWGQFGPDDELGRLNLITPEAVKNGLSAVKHGLVINLKSVAL